MKKNRKEKKHLATSQQEPKNCKNDNCCAARTGKCRMWGICNGYMVVEERSVANAGRN